MSKNHYIEKSKLLKEVLEYQDKLAKSLEKFEGQEPPKDYKHGLYLMSADLARMVQLLVHNIANSYNFRCKPYREDMEASVVIDVLKAVKSFKIGYAVDNKKEPNAYGYLTRCTQLAMVKYCDKENEYKSKLYDYIIDTFDLTENLYMFEENFKESVDIIKRIRNNIDGKWKRTV